MESGGKLMRIVHILMTKVDNKTDSAGVTGKDLPKCPLSHLVSIQSEHQIVQELGRP
jgi:hypothetical protein